MSFITRNLTIFWNGHFDYLDYFDFFRLNTVIKCWPSRNVRVWEDFYRQMNIAYWLSESCVHKLLMEFISWRKYHDKSVNKASSSRECGRWSIIIIKVQSHVRKYLYDCVETCVIVWCTWTHFSSNNILETSPDKPFYVRWTCFRKMFEMWLHLWENIKKCSTLIRFGSHLIKGYQCTGANYKNKSSAVTIVP